MTLLTLFACAQEPFMVQVVNSSGAPLTLEWQTPELAEDGEAIWDGVVISQDGGSFEYTGTPERRRSWDVQVTALGSWATGTRTLVDQSRGEVGVLEWSQDDITNFELRVTADVDLLEFYIKPNDQGGIAPGEQPGQNYGPISGGVPSSVSRTPIDSGFAWVARTEDGEEKGVILGEEHWKGMTINLDLAAER